jgi:integrase
MASIIKRGEGYRASIKLKIEGELTRETATFDTKRGAEVWARRREAELKRSGSRVKYNDTFVDLVHRYLVEVSIEKRGHRWEKLRLEKILREYPFTASKLSDISARDFQDMQKHMRQTLSDSTVNRYFQMFSHVYNVAIKRWEYDIANPLQRVPKLKDAPHRTRRVDQEDINKLFEACKFDSTKTLNKRQMAVLHFLIAIETAMRSAEICSITEETWFPDKRYVHLAYTKSGLPRDVPLSSKAMELIEIKLQHPPITAQQVDAHFRAVKNKTDIEDLHFHDSRHEACTRLAQKVSVMELARIAGHSNPKQTMVYSRISQVIV